MYSFNNKNTDYSLCGKKAGERKPHEIIHYHSRRKEDFMLSILHTRNGLKRALKSVLIVMSRFGQDRENKDLLEHSVKWFHLVWTRQAFTLGEVMVILLGGPQPYVWTPGNSSHHPWNKGSSANISCNLLAKTGLLATGLRQEHRLQHVAACSPRGYPSPSCKSENLWNQYLQDCPGFVPTCNLRWDTDLQNLTSSHLHSSLSSCYFCESSRSNFENWAQLWKTHTGHCLCNPVSS